MSQSLLFPDPRPLVERLGRDFFRQLPERPGVYLMRDARDTILYIGKAKNLRKRLGSYRVANPDRLPRRLLRLLHAVDRIELQECPDETTALAREAQLLREIKPKHNRAGTWPGKPRFLQWRQFGDQLEFTVTETPDGEWNTLGPTGRHALYLRVALVRLFWLALRPQSGLVGMPHGWAAGQLHASTVVACGEYLEEIIDAIESLSAGQPDVFDLWLREKTGDTLHPFDQGALELDLEYVIDLFQKKN